MLRQHSFQVLDKYWIRSAHRGAPENAALAVVGNKSDMKEKRQVTSEEGMEFAQKHGAVFIEVSAKTGENVCKLFEELGELFQNVQTFLISLKAGHTYNTTPFLFHLNAFTTHVLELVS